MNHFSQNLTYLRQRFNVKQNQLALHMKKAQTTIANWENKKSEPNIEELIQVVQFFGLTVDTMLFVDIENSNLISESDITKFKLNGNLIGNPIGNLKPLYAVHDDDRELAKMTMKEPDPVKDWAYVKILKEMDEKLDQLLLAAKKKK